MGEKKYPWLGLRHRLKEVPGFIFAQLAGSRERKRVSEIVQHRQARRAELERKAGDG